MNTTCFLINQILNKSNFNSKVFSNSNHKFINLEINEKIVEFSRTMFSKYSIEILLNCIIYDSNDENICKKLCKKICKKLCNFDSADII